jgi:hypothetical protein
MNESAETKICPHCAETIKTAAKVCPHCRYWQKRWSWHNPRVGISLWIAASFAMITFYAVALDKLFGPKESSFATYRDEISVVTSQFSHRGYESNLMNTVIGTLTNRSKVGWKDVSVEVQFFDKSGKQIDAITAKGDDYRGAVILPYGEVAFKVEGTAAHPEADYDKYKVYVRWAKDIDSWQ